MASVKEYVQSVVNAIGEVNPNAGGTAINPTGTYDKIYLNTKLSKDEVISIIEKLDFTYYGGNDNTDNYIYIGYYSSDYSSNIVIAKMLLKQNGVVAGNPIYYIAKNGTSALETIYWGNDDTIYDDWLDFENPISISNVGGLTELQGLPVGQQNDLLKNLVSATPFNSINAQDVPNKIRELKVEVENQVKPTGTYSKLYFNTSLSVEEVDSVLSKLPYENIAGIEIYYMYISLNGDKGFVIFKGSLGNIPFYSIFYKKSSSEQITIYSSASTGWQDVNYAEIEFDSFTGESLFEYEGVAYKVGTQNKLLNTIISPTSFFGSKQLLGTYDGSSVEVTESGVVDIGAMLDEGKLPLEVNVNVQSGGDDMLQARVDATNSCANLFYNYTGTSVDYIKNLDTSNVTNMGNMFAYSSFLTTIPLLNTSNVTNVSGMFQNCTKLQEIPQMDTSKVTSMSEMVKMCSSLTTIPTLDTSNVTDMKGMFQQCTNLTTIPSLNTSKVTNMSYMFQQCTNLTTIPTLDTSNVTNMQWIFYNCHLLTTIPQINMVKVTSTSNTQYMFFNCSNLTNLTLLNIKINLQIGNGTSWGHLLTLDSLINTCKELINAGSALTLTMGTANLEKIASVYVKFTDSTQTTIASGTKGDVVVCESTDEGAMLLSDYALLKNWTLA